MSGTRTGSGIPTFAPPKYKPPHRSEKKFGWPSASRWPQVPEPIPVVNSICRAVVHGHVVVVVDVVVVVVVPGHG